MDSIKNVVALYILFIYLLSYLLDSNVQVSFIQLIVVNHIERSGKGDVKCNEIYFLY